jgi:hypothetical protein
MAQAWDLKFPSVDGFYSGEGGPANMFLGSMKQMQQMKLQKAQNERAEQQLQLQKEQEQRLAGQAQQEQQLRIDEHNRKIAEDDRRRTREEAEQRRKDADEYAATTTALQTKYLNKDSPDYNPAAAEPIAASRGMTNMHLRQTPLPEEPSAEGIDPAAIDAQRTRTAPAPVMPLAYEMSPASKANFLMSALGRAKANPEVEQMVADTQAYPERKRAYMEAQEKPFVEGEGDAAIYLARRQQYEKEKAVAEAARAEEAKNPVFEADTKYGPVSFDPGAHQRNLARIHNEAADRVHLLSQSLEKLDPYKANMVAYVEQALRTQQIKPEEAQKQLNFMLGMDVKLTTSQMAADSRAKLAEAEMGLKYRNLGEREKGGEREDVKLLNADMKRFEDSAELKQDINQYRNLKQGMMEISSNNSILQRGVKFKAAKGMAGSGVMSNQDFAKSVEGAGGKLSEIESMFSQWADGTLGTRERRMLYNALKYSAAQAKQRIDYSKNGFKTLTSQDLYKNLGSVADAHYRALFGDLINEDAGPSGLPQTTPVLGGSRAKKSKGPTTATEVKVKVKGGAQDPVDRAQELMKF